MSIFDWENLKDNPIHETILFVYQLFNSDFVSLLLSVIGLGGTIYWITTDNQKSKKIVGWAILLYVTGLITKHALPDRVISVEEVFRYLVAMIVCAAVVLGFFALLIHTNRQSTEDPEDEELIDDEDTASSIGEADVEPVQIESNPQPKNRKIIMD